MGDRMGKISIIALLLFVALPQTYASAADLKTFFGVGYGLSYHDTGVTGLTGTTSSAKGAKIFIISL